jgi:hypothetical protein
VGEGGGGSRSTTMGGGEGGRQCPMAGQASESPWRNGWESAHTWC